MLPPVIYLNCHDAGRLMQPYGHAVPTPHLQRFAGEAILFRNAHTVAPTCSPSRTGLLTGRYPHQEGMLGLAHRGFKLRDRSRHLAKRLEAAGYRTVLSGQEHVGSLEGGRDERIHTEHLTPKDTTAGLDLAGRDRHWAVAAARYMELHADGPRPFYLECGFFFPHRPYPEVAFEDAAGDPAPPAYLPDTAAVRGDMRAYAAAMGKADECFGIVFDAMRRTGLDRRAIIVVTTDHGPAFPWAKCNLNDQGTGVMLMMRLPQIEGACVSDALVTHLDILPTIDETLGLPPDESLEGRSLLPLLRRETSALHEEIFSEVTYHAAYEPMRSVRTARHRYTRRYMSDWLKPVLPNIDEGCTRTELLEAGLRDVPFVRESLHDLVMDPMGANNLARDPAHSDVLSDLRTRLDAWMARTNDPLGHGPVCLPAGAVATPREGLNPSDL